jgi:hypothetical protein
MNQFPEVRMFLFPEIQKSSGWYPVSTGPLFPRIIAIKQLNHEDYHLPPTGAEAWDAWNSTTTHPTCLMMVFRHSLSVLTLIFTHLEYILQTLSLPLVQSYIFRRKKSKQNKNLKLK